MTTTSHPQSELDGANQAPDEANQAASWTIKSMPVAVRRRAIECAQRLDETVAEWMARAVNRQADVEAANAVLPPGKPEADPAPDTAPPTAPLDLGAFAVALEAVVRAHLTAGIPVPASIGREARATFQYHLRAARGLPPRQTSPRKGQTTAPRISFDGAAEPGTVG